MRLDKEMYDYALLIVSYTTLHGYRKFSTYNKSPESITSLYNFGACILDIYIYKTNIYIKQR